MSSFNDVFERKEVKYVLNAHQYEFMVAALSVRMAPDLYGETTISSIYYDTPHRDLISRSLEKPTYKEKLRVRNYGDFHETDRVFIELKKKFKGIVYKRRIGLSRLAANAFLGGMSYEDAIRLYPIKAGSTLHADKVLLYNEESTSYRSCQIAQEIASFVERYDQLHPSMALVCERIAWAPLPPEVIAARKCGIDTLDIKNGVTPLGGIQSISSGLNPDSAEGVRVTFDRRVRYHDYHTLHDSDDAKLHAIIHDLPDNAVEFMKSGDSIMEIKVGGAFPLWLVHALDECQAYPSSFSKYGSAYKHATLSSLSSFSLMQKRASRAVLSETQSKSTFEPCLVQCVNR